MKTKLKIGKVWIEHRMDENPDTSRFGKFTDKGEPNAIIRIGQHAGKFCSELGDDENWPPSSREYRFFVPSQNIPHNAANWSHVKGKEIEAVIAKHGSIENADKFYALEDWKRMESLNLEDWHYIGIIAKCEVLVPIPGNPGSSMIQTIHSGGLWGIESDSEASYLAEVGRDELANLRAQLLALGLGNRAITHAFKTVQTVNK